MFRSRRNEKFESRLDGRHFVYVEANKLNFRLRVSDGDCLIMAFSVRLERVINLHTDHTKCIGNRDIDGLQKVDTKLQGHWRFWVSVMHQSFEIPGPPPPPPPPA